MNKGVFYLGLVLMLFALLHNGDGKVIWESMKELITNNSLDSGSIDTVRKQDIRFLIKYGGAIAILVALAWIANSGDIEKYLIYTVVGGAGIVAYTKSPAPVYSLLQKWEASF